MKYEGRITLTRNTQDIVTIRIQDDNSRQQITEVSMTLENFALLMTGLSEVECQHETAEDVSNIGKTKVIESRNIVAPFLGYGKEAYIEWLENNGQEEGWTVSLYLGSQRSIMFKDDNVTLNYNVYKYI